MELKIWAKSFFSIYRFLDKLAKTIDSYVDIRACSCFYKNISSIVLCDTLRVSHDITALTNKKINLINVKVLTEKMLLVLPSNQARFVILKYFENKTFDETAERMEVSIRSVLRWNSDVMKKCEQYLIKNNFDEERLLDLIGNEKWILDVVKDLEEDEKNKHQKRILYFKILKEAEKSLKELMI